MNRRTTPSPFIPELDFVVDGLTGCTIDDRVLGGAVFDADARYRYALWRHWDSAKPPLAVIGLNPSTADASADDPTIRRCVRFARDWRCGSLLMLNLFAYRATDPKVLRTIDDPVGRLNDAFLDLGCALAWQSGGRILAAWGAHGSRYGRAVQVGVRLGLEYGADLICLGLTKEMEPRHPLYVPANTKPIALGLSL